MSKRLKEDKSEHFSMTVGKVAWDKMRTNFKELVELDLDNELLQEGFCQTLSTDEKKAIEISASFEKFHKFSKLICNAIDGIYTNNNPFSENENVKTTIKKVENDVSNYDDFKDIKTDPEMNMNNKENDKTNDELEINKYFWEYLLKTKPEDLKRFKGCFVENKDNLQFVNDDISKLKNFKEVYESVSAPYSCCILYYLKDRESIELHCLDLPTGPNITKNYQFDKKMLILTGFTSDVSLAVESLIKHGLINKNEDIKTYSNGNLKPNVNNLTTSDSKTPSDKNISKSNLGASLELHRSNLPAQEPNNSQLTLSENCFKINDELSVDFVNKSLSKLNVDAIVNAANDRLAHVGGLALAIIEMAGSEMDDECRKIIRSKKQIPVGECVSTNSGKMKFCKKIIHAVGPEKWNFSHKTCYEKLKTTFENVINCAEEEKLISVAIPPISSGIFGVPIETVALSFFMAIESFKKKKKLKYVKRIFLFDRDKDKLDKMRKLFEKYSKNFFDAEIEIKYLSTYDPKNTSYSNAVTSSSPSAKFNNSSKGKHK